MTNASEIARLDREAVREAKAFMGETAWPTMLFGLVIVVGYAATFWAVAEGELGLVAGFFINGLLVYGSYTVLHETVHGNVSGFGQPPQWYNELFGYLSGFIMAIPLSVHRVNHLTHHRKTNDPEADPDMVMAIHGRPGLFSVFVASLRSIVKQYTFFLGPAWGRTTPSERRLAAAEMAVSVGVRVGLALAGYPMEVLVLTVLANLLGNFIIVAFFAVAVHNPNQEHGRYRDTSTILLSPSWLNRGVTWLWLWQNYHSVHHLFPRIPFYRYAQVFDRIDEIMTTRGAPIHRVG
ncbi:MAG: fatty acid desaturase [Myxococcota bacterium]|nr:fatty acid desaturase [Myxococcota bacterium]